MAVETQDIAPCGGDHAVQFYADDSELAHTVGSYLIAGLRTGAATIVIATAEHRRKFEAELEAAGVDIGDVVGDGTLVSLDAAETLARFTDDGDIDPEAFSRTIGAVLRRSADTGRPVRAYGEMVSLLWEAGDVLGAIEVEKLWNQLALEFEFSLLCGYRSEAVSGSEHAVALEQVCHLHSSVFSAPIGAERNAEVARRFPAKLDAPREARRFLVDTLREWGHEGAMLDEAQLVLSELATNAVVHACSPFLVIARREDSGVRISVHDRSPELPTLREAAPTAASGRGLRLVSALSSEWGVDLTADGKTVWVAIESG